MAICDPNLEAAQKLAGNSGVPASFPSLREALQVAAFDGAVITTPTFTHHAEAVAALEAGISIHLEKPMAMNLSECHAITAAADRSGAAVQLGFMRRFDQDFIDAAAMLRGGEIGTPMIIKSLTHGPGLPPAWANDIRTSNGMLAEVTSHDLAPSAGSPTTSPSISPSAWLTSKALNEASPPRISTTRRRHHHLPLRHHRCRHRSLPS